MNPPEFPKEFLKHCPKVLEAKDWHERLKVSKEDETYAECAFRDAGVGKECENCGLFLTRPFLGHKLDEEFLPQIEAFYRQMDEYEEWLKQRDAALLENGAGI